MIIWGPPLDMVKDGSEVEEATIKPVGLSWGGTGIVGVSPIPDVTKGEFTVRGQDAKTRLMFDFREEPFAGVV